MSALNYRTRAPDVGYRPRIAEYRDGHISRTEEWADCIEWSVDRGDRARRAIEAFEANRWCLIAYKGKLKPSIVDQTEIDLLVDC